MRFLADTDQVQYQQKLQVLKVTKLSLMVTPLAGQNLKFHVEIVAIREATEELAHGHVHGEEEEHECCGGHGHGEEGGCCGGGHGHGHSR